MLLDLDLCLKFGIALPHKTPNGYTAWTCDEEATRISSTPDVIFKLSVMVF
jgi:hypothetical protein